MRRSAIIMLALAGVLGLLAVILVRNILERQTQPVVVEQKAAPLATVVVAKNQLSFGDQLKPEFLKMIEWPAGAVPAGSFKTVKEIIGDGERRVVLRTILPDEPILKGKISGFGGRAALSAVIGEGLRAVSIRVNDVVGVAGFVLPGDHVDILLTRSEGDKNRITDVILQNVRVLGVDQLAATEKDQPVVVKAVTLEVTTKQAQKLALATRVGSLNLALRSEANTSVMAHRTVRERDLSGAALARELTAEEKAAIAMREAEIRKIQQATMKAEEATSKAEEVVKQVEAAKLAAEERRRAEDEARKAEAERQLAEAKRRAAAQKTTKNPAPIKTVAKKVVKRKVVKVRRRPSRVDVTIVRGTKTTHQEVVAEPEEVKVDQ